MERLARYILLSLLAALVVGAAAVPAAAEECRSAPSLCEEVRNAPREKADSSDVCLVCGARLAPESGEVLIIRGRRVPLHKDSFKEFFSNPAKYFSRRQPRGALFSESLVPASVDYRWLSFGILMLLAVAAVGSAAAFFVGRRAVGSSLRGSFGRVRRTADPEKCSCCGAGNHPSARRCTSCGGKLTPRYEAEGRRSSAEPSGGAV